MSGIRRVDLVVVEVGDRRAAGTVAALREVIAVGAVLAPPQHVVLGARRVTDPVAVPAGPGRLELWPDSSGDRLAVSVTDPTAHRPRPVDIG